MERPIHRHNDRWIVEHKRALVLLGRDANTNCGPAQYDCAQVEGEATAGHAQDTEEISRRFLRPAGMVYDRQKRQYDRLPASLMSAPNSKTRVGISSSPPRDPQQRRHDPDNEPSCNTSNQLRGFRQNGLTCTRVMTEDQRDSYYYQ